MKRFIATTMLAMTLAADVFAQGTVLFANDDNTRILIPRNPTGESSGGIIPGPIPGELPYDIALKAGLFYSTTENGTYALAATTLVAPNGTGRFSGGNVVIPGVPGGEMAWFQVRVWEQAYGNTWEEALSAPARDGRFAALGQSSLLHFATGTLTPAALTQNGLRSFTVTAVWVPEPSPLALGFLGLVVGGVLRWRRKQS